MEQLILRFFIGGVLVSCFAALGDVLKPKSFAGLFGAAPSVGLATLVLTVKSQGHMFAALQARSMVAGAAGFLAYACASCWLMMRCEWRAAQAAIVALVLWFVVSFSLWFAVLK